MHICWKSFFLAFGVAVLLFSLLMVGVCVGVFNKFVPPAERHLSADASADFAEMRSSYENYIFYCNDKQDRQLDFALLIRIDPNEKQLLVTEIGGEDILERQGMLFYIHSLCQTHGNGELSPIFAALTGYEVSNDRILNVRDYMPQAEMGATLRSVDFLEKLPNVLGNATDGFSIVECPLVIEENHDFRVINIEKSLEAFLLLK